ncbi:hypothetical protein [Indioceanicola profundi]|uniref:hypothetical protein n=1 Tax=Indioceanicola profundi TaxID=2220096 RepID=UPI000E6AC6D9|nr:hypothetical protein [Indioceanicola profundi]
MAESPRSATPRGNANERVVGSDGVGPANQREGDGLPNRAPTQQGMAGDQSAGSRSSQARAMHDDGQYRDKIPVKDPATSPLGTDSEASGARAGEGSMDPTSPMGGTAEAHYHPAGHAAGRQSGTGRIFGMTLGVGVVVCVVAAVLVMAAL